MKMVLCWALSVPLSFGLLAQNRQHCNPVDDFEKVWDYISHRLRVSGMGKFYFELAPDNQDRRMEKKVSADNAIVYEARTNQPDVMLAMPAEPNDEPKKLSVYRGRELLFEVVQYQGLEMAEGQSAEEACDVWEKLYHWASK